MKDRLDRSYTLPYNQMRVLFTATRPHARETEGYEQRNKEMKVVFSPNLHLSVYPGTSAFYCDRATCTRAERIYKMKDRRDRSYTLSGGITAAMAVLARSASP